MNRVIQLSIFSISKLSLIPLKIEEMHFSVFMLFASVYASTSFGGTLEIVDFDGQCAVWSNNNHGCTGHSAPFAKLDGDDCSRRQLSDEKLNVVLTSV
jgi:hypothetical protein